jgi:hypothetical protein
MLPTSYTKWKARPMTGYYHWPCLNPFTTAWMPASQRVVGQTLLSTFVPKTTIVENVTGPLSDIFYNYILTLCINRSSIYRWYQFLWFSLANSYIWSLHVFPTAIFLRLLANSMFYTSYSFISRWIDQHKE